MAATEGNSRLSATSSDTRGRNLGLLRKHIVPGVEQSSPEQLHATATWSTANASLEGRRLPTQQLATPPMPACLGRGCIWTIFLRFPYLTLDFRRCSAFQSNLRITLLEYAKVYAYSLLRYLQLVKMLHSKASGRSPGWARHVTCRSSVIHFMKTMGH